jgi:hypothetical protein
MYARSQDMTLNAAGERIFGAKGLLSSQWRTSKQTAVPAKGASLNMRMYKGTYTLQLDGCTTSFTVTDGKGIQTVLARNWECAPGSAPPAQVAVAAKGKPKKKKPTKRSLRAQLGTEPEQLPELYL